MKKIYVIAYSVLVVCLLSCSDQATEKNESVKSEPAKTSVTTPPTVVNEQVEVKIKETPKTEISIGQQGGSVKTKNGTDVSLDKKGVKVGTKDVNIDIKTDSNQ